MVFKKSYYLVQNHQFIMEKSLFLLILVIKNAKFRPWTKFVRQKQANVDSFM